MVAFKSMQVTKPKFRDLVSTNLLVAMVALL